MIGAYVKGRVYVFIDAANIFYTQRSLKWRISYERLKQYLREECGDQLGEVFVYTAFDPERVQQKKFLNILRITGCVLRTKEVKRIRVVKGVYEWKGDFDVELTMDVMNNVHNFDSMVLLSGDSDFAPIVRHVKEQGKPVVVLSSKDHVSRELIQLADKFINLKKLKERIELVK